MPDDYEPWPQLPPYPPGLWESFEGVNREPAPELAERSSLERLQRAWEFYRAELERLEYRKEDVEAYQRECERTLIVSPELLEKLKAWALENGIHPITGKPYP